MLKIDWSQSKHWFQMYGISRRNKTIYIPHTQEIWGVPEISTLESLLESKWLNKSAKDKIKKKANSNKSSKYDVFDLNTATHDHNMLCCKLLSDDDIKLLSLLAEKEEQLLNIKNEIKTLTKHLQPELKEINKIIKKINEDRIIVAKTK